MTPMAISAQPLLTADRLWPGFPVGHYCPTMEPQPPAPLGKPVSTLSRYRPGLTTLLKFRHTSGGTQSKCQGVPSRKITSSVESRFEYLA